MNVVRLRGCKFEYDYSKDKKLKLITTMDDNALSKLNDFSKLSREEIYEKLKNNMEKDGFSCE